ncbi:MAG: prepilin-type N-terminal cleavage/methylation domain-containing protein [Nitrospirota bacterium]
MKTNRGFILLELIVVLLLMAVMLGMSTVLFTNLLPSQKFHATVREVSATIRQARSLAQINSETQYVLLDLDAKQYGIEGRGVRNIPEDISVKIADPFSGEILEGKYYLVFDASGGVDGGAIVLWNAKKSVTIQADPVAGSVVVR